MHVMRGWGKKRWLDLSSEAKRFKRNFLDGASRYPSVFFGLPQDTSYAVDVWLYIAELKTKDKEAYKQYDGTNRIKFLEDCIKEATGIDDRANLDIHIHKREDRSDPRVEIFIVPTSENVVRRMPTVVELLEDLT